MSTVMVEQLVKRGDDMVAVNGLTLTVDEGALLGATILAFRTFGSSP